MNRTIALPRTFALAALAVALLGACGSDSDKTSIEDLSTADVTLPAGITLPEGVGLPTGDCQAIYLKFVAAMTSAYLPAAQQIDYDETFGDVSAAIPADLQDDLAILAAAFHEYGEILAANNHDTSSPEVQAAIQALATDEVNEASNNLQDYFDTTCPPTP